MTGCYHDWVAARRPAKHGAYYRNCQRDPSEIAKVVASGQVWGKPRGNYYLGDIPAVKANIGGLPPGIVGIEFFTDVEPDPEHWCVPGEREWSEGRPGVMTLEKRHLVAIPVGSPGLRIREHHEICEAR